MQQPHRRAILVCVAIIACVLLFALAVGPSVSLRGVAGPLVRSAESPLWSALSILGCFLVATALVSVVGKLLNAVVGLFILGCGVGLLAMRSGTVADIAFADTRLIDLAIEGFVWAILIQVAAAVVFRVSGPLPDQVPIDEPSIDGPLGRRGLLSQLAGALILPSVWLVAVVPTKGQAIGAAVVGSTVVGLAGRLFAPKTPPVLLFAAPMIFASLGYVAAHFMLPPAQGLDVTFVARSLPRIAFPMPVDYAAGSLAGVALGIGWARSFLKPHPAPA